VNAAKPILLAFSLLCAGNAFAQDVEKEPVAIGPIGPEWVHATKYSVTTNSVSGEAVLDFMFWPSPKRRFGWYLEPGYEYNFGRGHEQSLGISGGLLISIP
jgi:hypothetical protein